MNKNEKKTPGQPKKPKVIDQFLLRFREENEDLRLNYERLAKESNISLNDCFLKSLTHFLEFLNIDKDLSLPILEEKVKIYSQNIKKLLKNSTLELFTQKISFSLPIREYFHNKFINPLERKIIYLTILYNHFNSEFHVLEKILNLEHPFDKLKEIKYYHYYIKNKENDDSEKIDQFNSEILQAFLNKWFLQLDFYDIIDGEYYIKLNESRLESFICNELYKGLKTTLLYESPKNSKEISDESTNNLNIPKSTKKKLDKIDVQLTKIKEIEKYLMKEKINIDFEIFKKIRTLKHALYYFNYKSYDQSDKRNKQIFNLQREIKKKQLISQIDTFTKEDFLSEINYYFNYVMYNNSLNFPLSNYFSSSFIYGSTYDQDHDLIFRSSFFNNILELDGYFEYLKKNDLLLDFLVSLNEEYQVIFCSKKTN